MKALRIGMDAKRLILNKEGLRNFSRSMLDILLRHYPEHEYHLYTPHWEMEDLNCPILHESFIT